jgi:hypothetical protein
MRFRVNDGASYMRGTMTFGPGEEFEATGEEAKVLEKSGDVTRVDKPKESGK